MIIGEKISDIKQLTLGKLFHYGSYMDEDGNFFSSTLAQILSIVTLSFGSQFETDLYHFRLFSSELKIIQTKTQEQSIILESRIGKEHFYNVSFENQDEEARFLLVWS